MVGWDLLSNPYRGCDLSDPNHGWNSGRAQRDLGFLAPTANDDLLPIGYYIAEDLGFTRNFVKRFTTFDDYHCFSSRWEVLAFPGVSFQRRGRCASRRVIPRPW